MAFLKLFEIGYCEYRNDEETQTVLVVAENGEQAREKVKRELCRTTNIYANNCGFVVYCRDLNALILH